MSQSQFKILFSVSLEITFPFENLSLSPLKLSTIRLEYHDLNITTLTIYMLHHLREKDLEDAPYSNIFFSLSLSTTGRSDKRAMRKSNPIWFQVRIEEVEVNECTVCPGGNKQNISVVRLQIRDGKMCQCTSVIEKLTVSVSPSRTVKI